MRRALGVIACAFLALLLPSSPLSAQGGTVRGRVTDSTGAPLARVVVSIEAIGAHATSDEQGSYEIRGVPAGTRVIPCCAGHVGLFLLIVKVAWNGTLGDTSNGTT